MGSLWQPSPTPKGPAVFGSLGHRQCPVSDRWEGRKGTVAPHPGKDPSGFPSTSPHPRKPPAGEGARRVQGGPWGPQSGSPRPQLCSYRSSGCPDPPQSEFQLTGDAWVPGGKGPGSGEGVPQRGPGQEAGSSCTQVERRPRGGRTFRAVDRAGAKRGPGNRLRGARRGSPRIPSLRRSPPG